MSGPRIFSDNYLKDNGINAEEVKDDYDCYPVSHYDIYNGDTITIRDKKGNLYADTKMTKKKFFDCYGNYEKEKKYE